MHCIRLCVDKPRISNWLWGTINNNAAPLCSNKHTHTTSLDTCYRFMHCNHVDSVATTATVSSFISHTSGFRTEQWGEGFCCTAAIVNVSVASANVRRSSCQHVWHEACCTPVRVLKTFSTRACNSVFSICTSSAPRICGEQINGLTCPFKFSVRVRAWQACDVGPLGHVWCGEFQFPFTLAVANMLFEAMGEEMRECWFHGKAFLLLPFAG